MAYPDKILFDYYGKKIAEDFSIDEIGQPFFELADDADETTSYRFATKPTSGTCYIKFDRNKV